VAVNGNGHHAPEPDVAAPHTFVPRVAVPPDEAPDKPASRQDWASR
jgi:hypothetical protein